MIPASFSALAAVANPLPVDSLYGILVCVVLPAVVVMLGLSMGKQNATRNARRQERQRAIARGRRISVPVPTVAAGRNRRPVRASGRRTPAAV